MVARHKFNHFTIHVQESRETTFKFQNNSATLSRKNDFSRFRVRARAFCLFLRLQTGWMNENDGASAVYLMQKVEHFVGELAVIRTGFHDVGRRR